MDCGSLMNGTMVVPELGSVSIRSTIPSPLASAVAPGQLAGLPSSQP